MNILPLVQVLMPILLQDAGFRVCQLFHFINGLGIYGGLS